MTQEKSLSRWAILAYILAMFLPVIYFTVLTDNTNETNPGRVWLVCALLWIAAGMVSVPGKLIVDGKIGGKIKWVGLSLVFGLIEAAALIFLA